MSKIQKIFVKILHKIKQVCYNLKSCKKYIINLTYFIVIKNNKKDLHKILARILAQFERNRFNEEP